MVDNPPTDDMQFNMNIALLQRIDAILTRMAVNSSERELHGWMDCALTLKREVKYMFNQEEKDKDVEYLKELLPLDQAYQLAQRQNKMHQFQEQGKFYYLLEEYECFLKECLYKRNMLSIKKQNAREAVLG